MVKSTLVSLTSPSCMNRRELTAITWLLIPLLFVKRGLPGPNLWGSHCWGAPWALLPALGLSLAVYSLQRIAAYTIGG